MKHWTVLGAACLVSAAAWSWCASISYEIRWFRTMTVELTLASTFAAAATVCAYQIARSKP